MKLLCGHVKRASDGRSCFVFERPIVSDLLAGNLEWVLIEMDQNGKILRKFYTRIKDLAWEEYQKISEAGRPRPLGSKQSSAYGYFLIEGGRSVVATNPVAVEQVLKQYKGTASLEEDKLFDWAEEWRKLNGTAALQAAVQANLDAEATKRLQKEGQRIVDNLEQERGRLMRGVNEPRNHLNEEIIRREVEQAFNNVTQGRIPGVDPQIMNIPKEPSARGTHTLIGCSLVTGNDVSLLAMWGNEQGEVLITAGAACKEIYRGHSRTDAKNTTFAHINQLLAVAEREGKVRLIDQLRLHQLPTSNLFDGFYINRNQVVSSEMVKELQARGLYPSILAAIPQTPTEEFKRQQIRDTMMGGQPGAPKSGPAVWNGSKWVLNKDYEVQRVSENAYTKYSLAFNPDHDGGVLFIGIRQGSDANPTWNWTTLLRQLNSQYGKHPEMGNPSVDWTVRELAKFCLHESQLSFAVKDHMHIIKALAEAPPVVGELRMRGDHLEVYTETAEWCCMAHPPAPEHKGFLSHKSLYALALNHCNQYTSQRWKNTVAAGPQFPMPTAGALPFKLENHYRQVAQAYHAPVKRARWIKPTELAVRQLYDPTGQVARIIDPGLIKYSDGAIHIQDEDGDWMSCFSTTSDLDAYWDENPPDQKELWEYVRISRPDFEEDLQNELAEKRYTNMAAKTPDSNDTKAADTAAPLFQGRPLTKAEMSILDKHKAEIAEAEEMVVVRAMEEALAHQRKEAEMHAKELAEAKGRLTQIRKGQKKKAAIVQNMGISAIATLMVYLIIAKIFGRPVPDLKLNAPNRLRKGKKKRRPKPEEEAKVFALPAESNPPTEELLNQARRRTRTRA